MMENMMHMSDEQKAEHVVALIGEMRENSQEMRQWKNVVLARECHELLRLISDRDASAGMALALSAIIEQLPEYDMPRFVLTLLHYEWELLQAAGEQEAGDYPTSADVEAHIRRLEDYIDTEHVSTSDFMERYQCHLKFDPVERTPEWEAIYLEVEQECDRRLGDTPRGMGFCFGFWSTLREVLAEQGITWHSPSELNPRVMFD